MIKTKIATIGLSLALVLGVSAPAGAVTIAELQAQINALMAQLATLQGGTTTTGTYNFTQDLTVGSTGGDVTSLQMFLVGGGYLNMPAGVSYGYFGTLTRAAVAAWQAANGISPAVGYFGPISRAKANAMGGTTTGGTTTGGTTTGGIATPGVEGTLTVSLNSTPTGVKLYEGDSKKAVMGLKLEAKTSDIRVERVKINLGTSTNIYRKIADRVYIMDGSTVLATADLNADTVVKDGSNYYITVSGLSYVVPKDSTRVLHVALDAMSTWDSTFDGDSWTLMLANDGVRGTDGAGINQYSPTTGSTVSRNFTSEGELAGSATLKVSLGSNSPKVSEVIAADGADEDELDGLELLRFDVRAEKDEVTITDLDVTLEWSGSTATTSTVYLMDGSTVIGSESGNVGNGGTVSFDDIDFVVSKDSTETLKVVVDITDATATATVIAANTSTVTAENSNGDTVTATGSASGENMTVRNVGLEITLINKSITKGSTPETNNTSTSTAEATFTLRLKAVGGDIRLGTNASTTGALVDNDGNGASVTAPSFSIYRGGSDVTATLGVASTTGFTIPTTGTTAEGTNSRILAEGGVIELPVSFLFEGRVTAGTFVTTGSYSVQLSRVNWVSSAGLQGSTFMADSLDWRTSSVSMP